MNNMPSFRPKRKLGQIFLNIPGEGSVWVETPADDPHNLDSALKAASKAFWEEYRRTENETASTVPEKQEGTRT